MTTNPHVYSDIDKMGGEPHSIGEIWASVLYEILWNLIDRHGKNDGDFPDFDSNGVPTDGKFLTMKIVLDAMALQPCYPAFNQARKAIIDADRALTGGANYCELWAGFAKRGMGPDATNSTYKPRMDDFNLPVGCLN
jgi:extracellular elastinolytic metalloproteinase